MNGELTVKRLERDNGQWHLKSENPDYPDIALYEDLEMVMGRGDQRHSSTVMPPLLALVDCNNFVRNEVV